MDAVIVDAVRSPMGKGRASGALADVHPVELLGAVIRAIVERNHLDPALVDDVLVGCVGQVGEQSFTPGRQAWLGSGFPVTTPATTIDRRCGSSQQAVDFAVNGVATGYYDVAIAAGVESMSRVPMSIGRMGKDPFGPSVNERFALVPQGISAELIADKWRISREQLDEFAARSHDRAAVTADSGSFDDEIVPIEVTASSDQRIVTTDESIRRGTTVEGLATLTPAFATEEFTARFPDLDFKMTAGNSSQVTDGASALLVMSAQRAHDLGLTPIAKVVASVVVGDDPLMMLTGPLPATRRVLSRSGLSLSEIDVVEVNEAFASIPLAWLAEFDYPLDQLNPCGGAIALGHPLGATGGRIMTTMIHHLRRTGGRYGLQTMCEAGGMANATIIEVF